MAVVSRSTQKKAPVRKGVWQRGVTYHNISAQLIDQLGVIVYEGSSQQINPEEGPYEEGAWRVAGRGGGVTYHGISAQLIDELGVVVHDGSRQQIDPEEGPYEDKPDRVQTCGWIVIQMRLSIHACIIVL